jgi:hypothetical protein
MPNAMPDSVLVLSCDIWERAKQERLKPPYSRLKRVNLLHERNMPCIYAYITITSPNDWDFEFIPYPEKTNLTPYFYEQCEMCWQYTFVIDVNRGIQVCQICKHVIDENVSNRSSFVDSHGPSLPNRSTTRHILPRKHTTSFYKRINHFRTWINRLSGESVAKITHEQESNIMEIFQRYNITDPSFDQVRYILRRSGYQSQYNNTFYIMRMVSGTTAFEFKRRHIEKLVDRFRNIHETFTESRGSRVNMLSYVYLIKKFCELEGWFDIASSLPSIKCQEKLYSQDKIWKDVCKRGDFKFIPSV